MPTAAEADLFTKPRKLYVTPGFSGRFRIPWNANISSAGMELYIDGSSALTAKTTGSDSTAGKSITYRRIHQLDELTTVRVVFKMTDQNSNVTERLLDIEVKRKKS